MCWCIAVFMDFINVPFVANQYNGPNWHIHVVSTIHCLVVVLGSFFIFADNSLNQDRVFGYVRWAADIYSISCG